MSYQGYPIQYDLPDICQGSTYEVPFQILSSGTPVDITGYTGRMQVREYKEAPDPPLVDLTTANGGILIDGPNGKVTVFITNILTAAMSWDRGFYDIELIPPDGNIFRFSEGKVKFSTEVTR